MVDIKLFRTGDKLKIRGERDFLTFITVAYYSEQAYPYFISFKEYIMITYQTCIGGEYINGNHYHDIISAKILFFEFKLWLI